MRQYCARLACLLGVLCVVGSGCATGDDDDTGLLETPGTDGGADTSVSPPRDSGGAPYDSSYVPPPDDSGYVPPPDDSGGVPPDDSGSPPPEDSGVPPPPADSGPPAPGDCDLSNSTQAAIYFAEAAGEEIAGDAVPCGSGCVSGDCCYSPAMIRVPQ